MSNSAAYFKLFQIISSYFKFWAMCECQGDADRTNKSMPGEFSLGVWEASPEQMRGPEVVAKSSKSGNNSSFLL